MKTNNEWKDWIREKTGRLVMDNGRPLLRFDDLNTLSEQIRVELITEFKVWLWSKSDEPLTPKQLHDLACEDFKI